MIAPLKTEQDEIAKEIQDKTTSIDITISNIERTISLLRHYQIRLTSDIVTGKVDVSHLNNMIPVLEKTDFPEEIFDEEKPDDLGVNQDDGTEVES